MRAAPVIVAVLGALLAGCGGSPSPAGGPTSVTAAPPAPPDLGRLDRDLGTLVTGAQTCTWSPPGPECAGAQALVGSVMDRVGDVADAERAGDPAKSQRLNDQVRSLATLRRSVQSCYKSPPLAPLDERECRLAAQVLTSVALKIRKELAA